MYSRLAAAIAAVAVACTVPSTAFAAPPNDAFSAAAEIVSLPFTDTADAGTASSEPGEPQACWFSSQTVWYRITSSTTRVLRADMTGSSTSTNLNVYRSSGGGLGGLSFVNCASFGSSLTFRVAAGETYYLQAEGLFGGFGALRVNVVEIPPPSNDDFAAATAIGSLRYDDAQDPVAATTEAGEPTPSCASSPVDRTIWYAYTPSETQSISMRAESSAPTPFAAYVGSSLGDLEEIGCRNFGGAVLTFRAEAGTTYYLQAGSWSGFCCVGLLRFSLDVAAPPVAGFNAFPADPSIYDTIEFWGQSHDPAQAGIAEESFAFGDGTSAIGCCPDVIGYPPDATHRYAADGDFDVTVRAVTPDGREASVTRTITVRTHDVTIERLTVPQSASAGQTRSIVVGLANDRYPEQVEVRLLRSIAGGEEFDQVGSLTQSVPVRGPNRTTAFEIGYTFTEADAAAGKVTFKAVATIVAARDAIPADNTVVALPTRVRH